MRVGAGVRRIAAVSFVLGPLLAVVPMGSTVATAAGFSCPAEQPGYDVRSGDGWFAIADRVDVAVGSLLDVNGASSGTALHPGDRLCLPDGADVRAACAATTTVRRGDGWFAVAERAGASLSTVLAANGTDATSVLQPGDTVCLPAGSSGGGASTGRAGSAYTVRRGDSWFWIAERADTTVASLLEVNGASADRPLYPGDEIVLPAGATTPSSSPGSSSTSGAVVTLAALPTQGPCWYSDSWGAPRSGGRRHEGVDVFTVHRQYVYAVADGRMTLRKWAQPGNISGNAWRLTADDGHTYFYAHLFDFAPDVRVGSRVAAGQIIGWVGDTGNTTVDHLHFEVRPGGGAPVNPYPVLRANGGACNVGTPYTQPGGWVPD